MAKNKSVDEEFDDEMNYTNTDGMGRSIDDSQTGNLGGQAGRGDSRDDSMEDNADENI